MATPLKDVLVGIFSSSLSQSALASCKTGNASMYRGPSTPGAALSLYFLPSAVSTSALISLIQSGPSTWLSSLIWIATMVLPSWAAEATLVMASEALGLVLLENTTTDTTMATSTAATSSGTIGGSVHLALSISSVIGICPAFGALAASGLVVELALGWLLGGGVEGLFSSGINGSGNRILL